MTIRTVRKIIQIDEAKCNGCGNCVIACSEGALAIVDGKARLISEKYCDGLAACLGKCPQDAIRIIEREAQEFDSEAVEEHLQNRIVQGENSACHCPGRAIRELAGASLETTTEAHRRQESMLMHWPVQLTLVPPGARFLNGTDVILVADCVPFAYPNLHADFLKDHSVLVACPKLDNFAAHQTKLTQILQASDIKSLTVVHMEVPCCSGLAYMAQQAIALSGKEVPFRELIVSIKGEVEEVV